MGQEPDLDKLTAAFYAAPPPRRPKTTRHKNITRIDHPPKNTYGYNVRIRWNDQHYGKFFSDRVYGDRLAALDAAVEWRNMIEKQIGKPRTDITIIGKVNAKSGMKNIRRILENHTEYYVVTGVDGNHKKRCTRYSINKHGERRALRMALATETRWQKERIGIR
jgi:hypothetical protein